MPYSDLFNSTFSSAPGGDFKKMGDYDEFRTDMNTFGGVISLGADRFSLRFGADYFEGDYYARMNKLRGF